MGRWLSGLRSSKGKRDAGEQQEDDTRRYQLAPISCSTKRLNQSREPEANTFGEKLAFFLNFSYAFDSMEMAWCTRRLNCL